jgi:hypothetical protein
MGAPKELNLIYVVERDIFYKTVFQFLDNLKKMHCISLDKNSTFMSTPTEILFSAL